MPRISVWRCPKCGSTSAGPDEGRSRVDLTWMQCHACGEGGFFDSWERDEEWGQSVEVPEGSTALSAFVPPPPRGSPFGCERCQGADAGIAWEAGRRHRRHSLIDESHYDIAITACDCGQPFVMVFTERIDWVGGEDEQTWLLLPVLTAEVLQLQQCPVADLRAMVTRFAEGRRFVVHSWPTGGALGTGWRDGGFWIGPHD